MYRSLLFVPGNRRDRFEKAIAAGADAVCIDLEDAVAHSDKAMGRQAVVDFLAGAGLQGLGFRINGLDSPYWRDDCAALQGAPAAFAMIPKVDSAEQVAAVRSTFGVAAPGLWPIIESVRGLRAVWDIAASPGVEGLLFGAYDLSADIGCEPTWDSLLYARGRTVAAAAHARVDLLEAPWLDVRDDAGLRQAAKAAKAMGFTGASCIHPRQVGPVREVFSPTEEEVRQARRVIDAFDAADQGVVLLDGKLIELPVVRAARNVLAKVGG